MQSDNSGTGQRLVVMPGFALTPRGEEIEVCHAQTVCLPEDGRLLYVVLLHAERPSHPQPTANGQDAQFTRIEERFAICLEPTTMGDVVAVARLLREDRSWHVDNDFKPAWATKFST